MTTMIEITYNKKQDKLGPYLIRFEKQDEAMQWIKANEIEIIAIDYIDYIGG